MATCSDTLALIRRSRREQRIEDLLAFYPELVAPGWGRPRRQVNPGHGNRIDLLFARPGRQLVVEIKRGRVDLAHCLQLERYMKKLARPSAVCSGILVGRAIHADAADWIRHKRGRVVFKQLGRDIPERVVVCCACRKAYDARLPACPADGETVRL